MPNPTTMQDQYEAAMKAEMCSLIRRLLEALDRGDPPKVCGICGNLDYFRRWYATKELDTWLSECFGWMSMFGAVEHAAKTWPLRFGDRIDVPIGGPRSTLRAGTG